MLPDKMKKRIGTDADFVALKRYGYSLRKVRRRYPEGCPDHVIAAALMIDEEDVQKLYEEIVRKMRDFMGVSL